MNDKKCLIFLAVSFKIFKDLKQGGDEIDKGKDQ